MMQERDIVFSHWDPTKSSKRSSGFFSVLKWFKTNETTQPPPDIVNSASSSCSSIESVFSTDTVASFNFVPPCKYRPFGNASQPEKLILSGPETPTYRARIAQREIRRENDKDLTLRSKYNLFKPPEPDRGHSLPLMTKTEDPKGMHRRTASESSKHRKSGAYLHVKGKRKAPQPPGFKSGETLRRKKRIAPQPPTNPDVICNDSLKLDRGILKSAKETPVENKLVQVQEINQVTPKPWYKRTISSKNNIENKKVDPVEKRKSGNLSYLTNISELDREAMEILERETLKMKYLKSSSQAPAFMRPKQNEHNRTNSDSWLSPKRKSARDLIAKFNAITGKRDNSKAQTPPIQEVPTKPEFPTKSEFRPKPETTKSDHQTESETSKLSAKQEFLLKTEFNTKQETSESKRSLPNSPVLRTSATKQLSRTPWNCPVCTLENEYWRIICRVCNTIKPYFDDFTSYKSENKENKKILDGYNGIKISDLQRSVFQSNYPRISMRENSPQNSPRENSPRQNSSRENSPRQNSSKENSPGENSSKDIDSRHPKDSRKDSRNRESESKFSRFNLEKYFQKPAEKRNYEVQKSQSQPRISIFDYERMVDRPKEIPRSNILDEILKEMKKKEEQNRVEESKLEKIAFGSQLGFRKMDDTLDKKELKDSKDTGVSKDVFGGGKHVFGNGKDVSGGGKDVLGGGKDISGGGRDVSGGGKDVFGGSKSVFGKDVFGRDSKNVFGKDNGFRRESSSSGRESISSGRESAFEGESNSSGKDSSAFGKESVFGKEANAFGKQSIFGRDSNFDSKPFTHESKSIFTTEFKPSNDSKLNTQQKIEKMILGDEIKVEKPQYTNVLNNETNQRSDQKMSIVEKMILGDEIKVGRVSETTKNGAVAKIVGVKLKSDKSSDEERKNSAKKEEREKLKKMLIEMKNSLPKRPVNRNKEDKNRVSIVTEEDLDEQKKGLRDDNRKLEEPLNDDQVGGPLEDRSEQRNKRYSEEQYEELQTENPKEDKVELIIATTETVYENIKVKKTDNPKPIKVSSSAQTNAVVRRNPTPAESAAIKSNFQLIGAKDFAGISHEKTQDIPHTYANLDDDIKSKVFAGRSNTDTLEINRLLRRLETAIAGGELGQAAVLARELAQLKVPCSVIRQKSEDRDEQKKNGEVINIDMYVEDKVSHRGPFPLKVTSSTTVAELKQHVQDKYKIPTGVQRWILGKKLANEDNATLADHQVTTSGCPVFLYLVAPANDTKLETTALDIKEDNNIEITHLDEQQPMKIATITQPPVVLHHQQPIQLPQPQLPLTGQPGQLKQKHLILQTQSVTVLVTQQRLQPPQLSPVQEVAKPEDTVEITEITDDDVPDDVWRCPACTLLNPLVTNECEVCGQIRYAPIVQQEEEEGAAAVVNKNDTYMKLVNLDNADLVRNTEAFECLVCLSECPVGDGVVLRECLHQFCRTCLANTIEFSEEAEVKCPYRDNQYACDIALQDREVKALVTDVVYERHLAKSVKQAETRIENAFHCKTPDCKGWCIFEDNVNHFRCPVCRRLNCLTCQAIHEGLNCKQYQEQMESQSETDEDARRTRDMLEEMVRKGEALACPTCQVVLMKKWGCDWLRCSMCKTEICWVTRGPRWGIGGKGDTSGGCRCGVNGIKCHPKCNYCH